MRDPKKFLTISGAMALVVLATAVLYPTFNKATVTSRAAQRARSDIRDGQPNYYVTRLPQKMFEVAKDELEIKYGLNLIRLEGVDQAALDDGEQASYIIVRYIPR